MVGGILLRNLRGYIPIIDFRNFRIRALRLTAATGL